MIGSWRRRVRALAVERAMEARPAGVCAQRARRSILHYRHSRRPCDRYRLSSVNSWPRLQRVRRAPRPVPAVSAHQGVSWVRAQA